MKKTYPPMWRGAIALLAILTLTAMFPMSSYVNASNGSSTEINSTNEQSGLRIVKPCTEKASNNSQVDNPSVNLRAASQLIERWLPCKQAQQFFLKALDPSDYDQETFTISPGPGQHVTIAGSSTSALLMGWNWYLKYVANTDISLNGTQLDLPKKLPLPNHVIRRDANVANRHALNDTDEGYNDPYEDWEHWQRKIDILAMHGINEVLVYPGQAAVYYETFQEFGYTEKELRNWIPRPAHQPWWLMQNMYSFPSPISKDVLERRIELGQKIVNRLRELGMTPVFPGYYGTVPPNFEKKNPGAHVVPQGTWNGFERPGWLDPTNKWFPKVAAAFYQHQSELYGDTTMFKMDLLHEGGRPGNVDVGEASKAVQKALETAHPGAIWVILGWGANPRQELLAAIDKNKMLILDGNSDAGSHNRESQWHHTPYAFGTIWNFGGHTNMGANLTVWNQRFYKWLNKQNSALSGIALMPEALNNNPVAVEFFTEMPWRDHPANMEEWFAQYAEARYGAADPHAKTAWQTLLETAYSLPASRESRGATGLYTHEPHLFDQTGDLNYDPVKFEEALADLLKVNPDLRNSSAYQYDLQDVTQQVLANITRILLPKIQNAYNNGNKQRFDKLSDRWLHYIKLSDKAAATNEETMIGTWIQNAKSSAANDKERAQLEYDARSIVAAWGPHSLHNYARREWAGLLGDFYYSRWKTLFDTLDKALQTGQAPEPIDWYAFDNEWAHKQNLYPTEPSGNIHKIAQNVYTELANQPRASLQVTSDESVLSSGETVSITATFTSNNGFNDSKNVAFSIETPNGYTVDAQTPTSTDAVASGGSFTVKWNVTAPKDTSEQTIANFVVNATYKTGQKTGKTNEGVQVLVQNDIKPPFKTVSFNNAKFSQSGDEFAIYGGGDDLWKSYNQYGSIYRDNAFGSTYVATAKVISQDSTGPWARAGIMARNDLTQQNGASGYVNIAITPNNGCVLSWDSNGNGGLDTYKKTVSFTTPVYVRLSRNGSIFTGACSSDGETWTTVGSVKVPGAKASEDVGLFMTAANGYSPGGAKGFVRFKGFSVKPRELLLELPHRTLPTGVPVKVTTLFQNREGNPIPEMSASLNVPDGWNVEAVTSTKKFDIAPMEKVKVTWKVTASKDADVGSYNLSSSATFTSDGHDHVLKSTLPVELISSVDSLAEVFNNVGITDDNNPEPGNFDGGNSFSAQAMAEEGFTPGATISYNGVSFKWPDVPSGTPDNVTGQAGIQMSTKGNRLAFIGASVYDQTGTGAVIYDDGSVQEFTVSFPNYAGNPPSGADVVATFDYRNTQSGPANFGYGYRIFYDDVTLNPNKTVAAVILPDNPRIHIFSMKIAP